MTERPSVSVVTPAFNAAGSITESITSVINQVFNDWELLVVDDGSTDETGKLAATFAERNARIHVLRNQENIGRIASRNRAIRHAQGRYIAFLDSDDLWAPEKLQRQITFMQEYSVSLSFTGYRIRRGREGPLSAPVPVPKRLDHATLLLENVMVCSSVVYDTALIGKRYMRQEVEREDFALWLDILREGRLALGVNEPLVVLVKQPGSQSSNKLRAVRDTWDMYRHVEKLRGIRLVWVIMNFLIRTTWRYLRW